MTRRLWSSLLGISLVAVVLLALALGLSDRPAAGVDLGGGASVVLTTPEETTPEELLALRDEIRENLAGDGIDEADVRVEGRRVIADVPHIDDARGTLRSIASSGLVTLRPLMTQCAAPSETASSSVPASSEPTDTTEPATSDPSASTPATTPTDSAPSAVSSVPTGDAATSAPAASGFRSAPAAATTAATEPPASDPPTSSAPEGSDVPGSTEPATTTTTVPPLGPLGPVDFETGDPSPFEPLPPEGVDSTATLKAVEGMECTVGAAQRDATGLLPNNLVKSAKVGPLEGSDGLWLVRLVFTDAGQSLYTTAASACSSQSATCPTGMLGLVVDDVVQTPFGLQQSQTTQGEVNIVGEFTKGEAQDIARVLQRGDYPVKVEARDVQIVSATLGDGALRTALIAGVAALVVGFALLAFVYRRLAGIILGAVAVSGLLIYAGASFAADASDATLSLAGLAGIAVALGVAIDSHIVLFERLKDDVRNRRSLRNSALRTFRATWRGILVANVVALLGGALFWLIGDGSISTFGLFLGIATLSNLLVIYLFTRPAIGLLAARGSLDSGDDFGLRSFQ